MPYSLTFRSIIGVAMLIMVSFAFRDFMRSKKSFIPDNLPGFYAFVGAGAAKPGGDNRLPKATPGWVIPGAVKIYSPSMEPGLIVRLKRYMF